MSLGCHNSNSSLRIEYFLENVCYLMFSRTQENLRQGRNGLNDKGLGGEILMIYQNKVIKRKLKRG